MSCIVDENVFNCDLVPSLEDVIIVNLVTKLWEEPDLEDEIRSISIGDKEKTFNRMKDKISDKISLLPLPSLLKLKVINFVRPIGIQIFQWISYSSFSFYANPKSLKSLPWTIEGTIDKKKVLQLEIRNDTTCYNNYHTFKQACKLCLEDDIINLWRNSSDNFKEMFLNKDRRYNLHLYDELVLYWIHYIKNELPELISELDRKYSCNHSLYKNMVTFSVLNCNKVAVKYFWHKLTEEEVNNYLVSWVELVIKLTKYWNFEDPSILGKYQEYNPLTDTLCFLLSKMNDKAQRIEVFKKYKDVILENLLYYWPWQKLLLPVIQEMGDYIDGQVYVTLLSKIANEIKKGRNTENLLVELWYHSTLNFKKCFIQHSINDLGGRDLLWKLMNIEDLKSTKLIINAADGEEKKQIIFAMIEDVQLKSLICEDKLVLLDKLIEDNLSLECDISIFKEKVVMKHGNSLCHKWICDDNWQAVDKLFDWSLMSQDKIDKFKQNTLSRSEIVKTLILKGNDGSLNKFRRWCFNSEAEIDQFIKEISSK